MNKTYAGFAEFIVDDWKKKGMTMEEPEMRKTIDAMVFLMNKFDFRCLVREIAVLSRQQEDYFEGQECLAPKELDLLSEQEGMKPNDCVVLAENNNSWIQGHADDKGEKFEFFDIYFGNNFTTVSFTQEGFTEIVDLFRELIENEEEM